MIGKTLSHYEFEGLLGEGGSGVVYRGRDLRLERPVAIKVLADGLRDDEFAWARLLREARLASQLNHPNIAAIYDLGEEDDHAYIVMEYVEGLTLADLIPEGGMPIEQVERYVAQIAGALAFAHQQGVIHGDLKGSNIIVTPEGNLKLLDFGLGRRIPRSGMVEVTSSRLPLAEVGATAGTLPYLAPEVLRGSPTSMQSDVWALGVLLYQMATGELPFRGGTPFEISMEIMVGTPPKLAQLPEPLQSTLRGCLEKDASARISQGSELASRLEGNALRAEPSSPAPAAASPIAVAEPPAALPASRRRRKWWVAGAATALFLLLLGGIYARHVWVVRHAVQPIPESPAPKVFGAGNSGVKVWVNTNSATYHCPGTRWYGKTQEGQYMTQKEAQDKGYHPAAGRACM
ncbi:MAG: serine/threonine-protein kinase [Terriglobia bacterium]|jgi:serine/threonine-protein kinase